MKVAWLSNSPWASTGYGNQTKLFVPRLQTILGHEMAVIAFYGLEGGVLQLPDGQGRNIPIYPRGFHPYGQDVVGAHSAHFQADITMSLMDSWVCEPSKFGKSMRWVPWFPIDHAPLPDIIRKKVAASYQPITMSKFGQKMAEDAGLDARYVPHGVDTKVFSPGDKKAAREVTKLPQDTFLVGMVAANKGSPSRKAFPQHLEAFSIFHKQHPDSMLYLHTTRSENGEHQGVNLPELIKYLGLEGKVLFPDQYALLLGLPDTAVANIYRSLDVLMNVSMGEGFGIPILEAQACGTPVIVGDWTSMSELCFGGWKVDAADTMPYWTPLAAYQWIPKAEAIAECLSMAYSLRNVAVFKEQARAGALAYDADLVTKTYWKPVLDEIAERVGREPAERTNGHTPTPAAPPTLNRAQRRQLAAVK